ncbi:zinc finger Ran-binding domain-containing protein 2 isoform X1 [Sesamum indicum]|uniref:Zinc finger Ran-binding domain-containing protein 2 isoform X1 n=2 Tax=Sesamum indicum TaxID=4182 RepID=A0A6I9T3M1_SESIN|nr:zinc finger Ran-binding domain-containing protein 2 isoform X1 [Sesamum indicum]
MCAEREMGSREKDHKAPHQPLLSSLVVRPTDSGGGGGGGAGAGSDYEPGEVRRDPPPYSRSDRHDGHGYRMRAGSVSPVRRRDAHHRFSPGFEHSDGARSRGFGNGRDTGRYRDYSPPYGHGKDGRFSGRDYDRSARGPGSLRVEGLPRNNPNVRPREGDWICSDPSCKNLNFARREHCNNCNRPRYASSGSPRRGYPGPPFPPRQRVPAAPLDHSPGRIMNGGYRSPPRGWPRDAPRDFRAAGPPARHEGRFPDPLVRGDRQDYPEDDPRDRYRYDRPMLPDWGHRDRGRDNYFNERRGYGRRPLSPPPAPAVLPRGWASNIRERSRSPVRGGVQPRDYQRDIYMNRRRDDRRGVGGGAF